MATIGNNNNKNDWKDYLFLVVFTIFIAFFMYEVIDSAVNYVNPDKVWCEENGGRMMRNSFAPCQFPPSK